ncbi:MAG: DNA-binding response regulator [Spirochaetae bacterium HGW-Spirochaetae-8]|jgi:DNA-binding response OmpR family regulator|nr:MAG: DNA-binding response regulator [Spirochaetae bacterium HGW-Spirochaetae-8]
MVLPPKRKVLVVDDEDHIVELLVMNLRQHGFETCATQDGRLVLEVALREKPDLILLDLMLPGLGGLEVCRLLKQDPRTEPIPVIMLTARSEESDKVIGLGIGADDYITKPFGLRELFARIEVVLRRSIPLQGVAETPPILSAGHVTVDIFGHVVLLDGKTVALSPTEFALVAYLVRNAAKTVRRLDLSTAGGLSIDADAGRSLDVHIRNIRKKFDSVAANLVRIETVRGIGYRLDG